MFASDVALSVEFLDCVIDNTSYPLKDQEAEAKAKRRMGIGVTGVANAIEYMGFPYGTDDFIAELSNILSALRDAAYTTSVRLAKEKGPFPLFDRQNYLNGEFIKKLPESIQTLIATYGIRNSHLISIAPTGTISLCADNISSGIEPVFTHQYDRKINTVEGQISETVTDYAFREWGIKGRTALELTPAEHIKVLAVTQQYCDSAVSKTVNIGDDITYEQFKDVYITAYKSGTKGCTTFRAAGKRMGVLTEKKEEVLDIPGLENGGEACTFDPETGRKTCE